MSRPMPQRSIPGAPARACSTPCSKPPATRPRFAPRSTFSGATLVQLGLGGEMTLPINSIVAKELQLRGTFRFDPEFELAVRLMGEGLIDVKPLITATMPFENAVAAFELASDRSQSMKVQLTF
ncbi:threonine dehydrogenase-like Zn-dependent dehydrogenase [Bradyrhizobium barranii subsp. barranii]|nr:threonine dehydrogenase-like Zn-dependent dehydrogenase [Bradyrhizobium japonicum]MCP1956306.1 threonine dehydrogenase-like Zn-dependent dehydrogenase [Bradyrhizobium japonicum]